MGLHHVGTQQTLFLSALGISGFQDTAQGFNSGSRKRGICHISAEIHMTQELCASGCERRLLRNCQSGSQSAHGQVKRSRKVSTGSYRANRLCLLLETVWGCCAGNRTMQRHVIAGLRHPQ